MSFTDNYLALFEEEKKKKKKKTTAEKTGHSFTDNYLSLSEQEKEESIAPVFVNKTAPALYKADDIAPVAKEDEERTWFRKGAFDDGYQFGDVTKTILGTASDLGENLAAGVLGMGERVVDAGAYLAGGVGKMFGADEFAEDTKEFISKDLYNEEEIAKRIIIGSEENSVLGEKSDSLVQSAGQLGATIGLQAVGVPWFVTTGLTSFGGEVEGAFNEGASFGEAGLSAAISAGAEILTEKISGGISFGGKTLDDALTKNIARNISNKTVRTLSKLGLDMAGEGAEELLSGVMGAIGKKITYADDKELTELFSKEEALESFIGGAVLGGGMGGINAVKSGKNGVDYASGLTANEEKVVNKVYEDRVAEAEKSGKLSEKEKSKIYDEVLGEMEKGGISTDTIEEVLGGDTYQTYQNTVKNEDSLRDTFNQLNQMKQGEMTGEQIDLRNELKEQLKELESKGERNQLKSQLGSEVMSLVQGDRLIESYNERARRGQAFEADLTKYNEKQKAVIQKAIDSGILNNTRRTHEFVDMVSKISADKGVLFDFANNAKLKESGFAVDGKTVNGFVTKDGVTLNIDAAKSLNSVVGHEITHVLEGTELYTALQSAVMEYAKTNGDYQGRYDSITKLYEGIEGANVDAELTADLVGDYLFTDSDFINNLSTNHRNVFQKIYDEVKYLCKVATAGSKEARELEKVKRSFEKAYKAEVNTQTDTKYSLGYHAGDLGKAESYAEQGYYRGTGHFGTGTYFAGDESKISDSTYGSRPHHSVEFDNYNLYKIRNDKDGYELHDQLKVIDGGFTSQEFLDAAKAKEMRASNLRSSAWERAEGYDDQVWNDELEMFVSSDYIGANIRAFTEVANENGVEIQSYDEWFAEQSLDESDYDYYKSEYYDYLKETLEAVDSEKNKGYDKFRDAYFHLWLRFGQDKVNRALQDVIEYDAKMDASDNDTKRIADSLATVFMKSLGYEGIDVRGTGLDNTTYGSVIYDLKGDDLAKKKAIGTAKFSVSAPDVINSLYNYDTVKFDKTVVDWNAEDFEEKWDRGYYTSVVETIAKHTGKSKQEVWNAFADVLMKKDGIAKVDGKTYINVHELSEENLRKAFELGGLAVPSIGIVDVDNPTTHFGRISLIFPDIFNPETVPTHYGDSYSTSLPAVAKFTDNTALEDALTYGFEGMEYSDILSTEEMYDLIHDLEQFYIYDERQRTSHAISENGFRNAKEFARNYSVRSIDGLLKLYEAKKDNFESYEQFLEDFAEKAFTNQRMHRYHTANSDYDWNDRAYKFRDFTLYDAVEEMTARGDDDFKFSTAERVSNYDEMLSDGMRARLKASSTGFYEAKPQRAVYIGEATYAVVPESTSADIVEMLESEGVKVVKYQGIDGVTDGKVEAIKGILDSDATGIRYSLTEYTAEEKKAHNKAVVDHFGKTYNWAETGYVLLDGTKLDLSGKHEGAPGGYRTVDHRDIVAALGDEYGDGSYSGSLVQFMSEGNIRISPESDGINLSVKPTKAQEQALSAFVSRARGEVLLDIDGLDGYTEVSVEYPRGTHANKVLNDIREWFDNGKKPEVSNVSQFRSLSNDGEQIAPVGKYNVYGKDIALEQEVSPVQEDADYSVIDQILRSGKISNSLATRIARDRDLSRAFTEITGTVLEGTTDDKRRVIRQTVRERSALAQENDALATEAAEDAQQDFDREQDEKTVRESGYRSYIRGILLKGANIADAREILSNPELRAEWETVTGKTLPQNAKSAIKMIRQTKRKRIDVPDIFPDDLAPVAEDEATALERLESLDEVDAPQEIEAPIAESEEVTVDNPFDKREWKGIGNPKIKAFSHEHPEVKPFFQAEAMALRGELNGTIKGERWYNDELYSQSGGEEGFGGTKRLTSDSIAEMLDGWGMSYATIEKGLDAIIDGNVNTAAAKKIEFMLNDRLLHGYTEFFSNEVIPPDEEYIAVLNQIQTTEHNTETSESIVDNDAPPIAPESVGNPTTSDLADIAKQARRESMRGAYTHNGKQYLSDGSFIAEFNAVDETLEQRNDFPIKQAVKELDEAFARKVDGNYDVHTSDAKGFIKVGNSLFGTKRVNALIRALENPVFSIANVHGGHEALVVTADNGRAVLMPVRASGNAYLVYEAQPISEEMDDIAPVAAPVTPKAETPKKEAYEAIRPKKEKQPRMVRATAEEQAKILAEEPKVDKKKSSAWSLIKNNILDKGMIFEDLSLATGNRELQARWNTIRYADGKAQRFMEKNLKPIIQTVEQSGKTAQFYEYLYHMHNADRMTLADRYEDVPNKPVFGNGVTAEMSRDAATRLEKTNPEFKQWAQEVYNYNRQNRELLVEGGVISREVANLWEEMYPHYVPIRRVGDEGLNINVPLDTGRTGVNAPIKRATGGNRDILPLFDTMGQRTMQTYKAIAKNRFGVELKNTLGTTVENEAFLLDEVIDGIDAHEELLQEGKNGQKPTFTVFENGEKVTFEITDEMYDAMKPKNKAFNKFNESRAGKVLSGANNIRRGLLTEYNPAFMFTNPIKDAQDVLMNSQHPARTYANFPKAVAELIGKKGHWYNEYMDNGGEQNTYFENETNTFAEEKSAFRKIVGFPLDKISDINNFIERVPRMAEYIASRKAGASVDVAMLDAARVTTNFAAGGDLTKFANRNGVTFLNASVQGAVQQVRNVREAKANGLKGYMMLAAKMTAAGLPAMLLNHLLWDDDEEYAELSDYVKQNYYIVGKYDDGKFVRIPKGRALAVIQNGFEQMENLITGNDEVDLATFGELLITNLAPNNPLDNNIFAPIGQALSNRTWYGEDLVPTRLQDLPVAEQYDETTDEISRWLGEKMNVSPYKLNYLLDQYSGGIGDTFLPFITPEAERGKTSLLAPLSDKFTTDSVMKNQNISDFYDTKDELAMNAKMKDATDEDILMSKYMNSVNSELSELYALKREVQNSDLPDDRKYEKVREIQEEIVSMTRDSLNTYKDVYISDGYAEIGDRHYVKKNGEWTKLTDKQLNKQEEVIDELGISGSDYWSDKDEYDFAYEYPEKYTVAKSVGGFEAYKGYQSDLYDIHADKDEDGKSINGSRKEKVADYINNLDADYGVKIILFKSEYNADDTYNYDIIEYLNGRDDISFEEEMTILKELGFEVDSEGNISWD